MALLLLESGFENVGPVLRNNLKTDSTKSMELILVRSYESTLVGFLMKNCKFVNHFCRPSGSRDISRDKKEN